MLSWVIAVSVLRAAAGAHDACRVDGFNESEETDMPKTAEAEFQCLDGWGCRTKTLLRSVYSYESDGDVKVNASDKWEPWHQTVHQISVKECATACKQAPNCTGFTLTKTRWTCVLWFHGACNGSLGAANPGWKKDEGAGLWTLKTDLTYQEAPATCIDNPLGWRDREGAACGDYEKNNWCNSSGYGPGWRTVGETFGSYAKNKIDAQAACCHCGGGKMVTYEIRNQGQCTHSIQTRPMCYEAVLALGLRIGMPLFVTDDPAEHAHPRPSCYFEQGVLRFKAGALVAGNCSMQRTCVCALRPVHDIRAPGAVETWFLASDYWFAQKTWLVYILNAIIMLVPCPVLRQVKAWRLLGVEFPAKKSSTEDSEDPSRPTQEPHESAEAEALNGASQTYDQHKSAEADAMLQTSQTADQPDIAIPQLGYYFIVKSAGVTEGPDQESEILADLTCGDLVEVVEVVAESQRMRARIRKPAGWISLIDTKRNVHWAEIFPVPAEVKPKIESKGVVDFLVCPMIVTIFVLCSPDPPALVLLGWIDKVLGLSACVLHGVIALATAPPSWKEASRQMLCKWWIQGPFWWIAWVGILFALLLNMLMTGVLGVTPQHTLVWLVWAISQLYPIFVGMPYYWVSLFLNLDMRSFESMISEACRDHGDDSWLCQLHEVKAKLDAKWHVYWTCHTMIGVCSVFCSALYTGMHMALYPVPWSATYYIQVGNGLISPTFLFLQLVPIVLYNMKIQRLANDDVNIDTPTRQRIEKCFTMKLFGVTFTPSYFFSLLVGNVFVVAKFVFSKD